ncbi:MAG TPA: lysine--tRNA ligase [Thermoplasmata archaeon]|nr:lysine--tRNA ligase [Thermoplasmata archaeon]
MPEESDEHRLERERREKVDKLRRAGVEPYPWEFPARVPTARVVEQLQAQGSSTSPSGTPISVAGRIVAVREHGKTAFIDLEDLSGRLQLLLRADELGEDRFRSTLQLLDSGDLIGARGAPILSRRGEPSLGVAEVTLLAKALHPPPEKYHGLTDPEARLRQRYVDLLSSAESRARFRVRSLLVRELRSFFDGAEFLEVETPILVPVASGAAAAPFTTRSNYLGLDLQLRIALELALKRLLVGGFERVYEIGHIFRNEDLDSTHSPEFTMLEAYWAYADYTEMQTLIERLYARLAERVAEWLPDLPAAREAPALFRPPFDRVDFVQALEQRSGIANVLDLPREELRRRARAAGATVPDDSSTGVFLDKLFDHYVLPHLARPTFVLDHPVATTPLAKRHRTKPGRVERFELFARGYELGNAYTELNDPVEQEARFREQLSQRGEERYEYDADFVEAMRYGMPPMTGVGIGVDRAMMALLGSPSIKDVILFLPVRPRTADAGRAAR